MSNKRKYRNDENTIDLTDEQSPNEPKSAVETATAAAHRLHSRSSLERLPNVLLHLCMQSLDFISLTRLSRTCQLIGSASLHPSAGRFLSFDVWTSDDDILTIRIPARFGVPLAHQSSLFRAHAPMTFELSNLHSLPVAFNRIRTLDISSCRTLDWNKPKALNLLTQAWLQGVTSVIGLNSDVTWMRNEQAQMAIYRLPNLTQLDFNFTIEGKHSKKCQMSLDAIKLATKLTHVQVSAGKVSDLAFLAFAPHLTRFGLSFNHSRIPWPQLTDFLLPSLNQLTHVQLTDSDIPASPKERAQLKLFFQHMSNLHTLELVDLHTSNILRGLMRAGVSAMPSLRRVECNAELEFLRRDVIRRFLVRFPLVHLIIKADLNEDNPNNLGVHIYFGKWPRVIIEQDGEDPPSPHASDADESDTNEDGNDDKTEKDIPDTFGVRLLAEW